MPDVDDTLALVETLLRIAGTGGDFPSQTLPRDQAGLVAADRLLDAVAEEIASTDEDVCVYFESSRDRYAVTIACVLAARPRRVLDLGCSPGHVAMALVLDGVEVHGVDLNREYLRKYAGPRWVERLDIRFIPFETEPLPWADGSFDVVTFTEVLEHVAVSNPEKLLTEIRRVLVPGGTLVLSTPNVANVSNVLALALGRNVFWAPEIFYGGLDRHNREYTPREVVDLVVRSGFAEVQLGYASTPANWNATASDETWEILGRVAGRPELLGHPLLANTIFVKARRPA